MAKAGRKQKIDFTAPEVLIDIEEKIRDGWDEKQVAESYGYCFAHFSKLKNTPTGGKQFSKLYEAIKRGQRPLNFQVENSLFKRATGLKVKTTTRRWLEMQCTCGGDVGCEHCYGSGKVVTNKAIIQEIESELPPDTGACMAWLKTRKADRWLNPENNIKANDLTNLENIRPKIVFGESPKEEDAEQ